MPKRKSPQSTDRAPAGENRGGVGNKAGKTASTSFDNSSSSSSSDPAPAPDPAPGDPDFPLPEPPTTLPEDIYWDYVRPYSPLNARPVLSRRCWTRLPPPSRPPVDDAAVEVFAHYKDLSRVWGGKPRRAAGKIPTRTEKKVWLGYPSANWYEEAPHTSKLGPERTGKAKGNPQKAEDDLRRFQSDWDAMMRSIESPAGRLVESILATRDTVGVEPMNPPEEEELTHPSLFPWGEPIGSVLDRHLLANPACLNGRLELTAGDNSFKGLKELHPPTPLGFFVWRFCELLYGSYKKMEGGSGASNQLRWYWRVVEELLDAGADASGFTGPISRAKLEEMVCSIGFSDHRQISSPWEEQRIRIDLGTFDLGETTSITQWMETYSKGHLYRWEREGYSDKLITLRKRLLANANKS